MFTLDPTILRASLVLFAAIAAIGATIDPARAQQYFNGSQTTPNGAINGGGGPWNNTTTNWTDDNGAVSNPYDPSVLTTTIFGASATLTPPTAGTVTVAPGGIQLTGSVIFAATGDNSAYTIRGGSLALAAGGTTFTVAGTPSPSAVITSSIVGTGGLNLQGAGTLLLAGASTYAGGTFICTCATLQLGDPTHTASIVGAVTNEGSFNVVNANTAGITSITNDGFFGGPATTNFFNKTTAGTATIVNQFGGTTVFNDFSLAANSKITNFDTGGSTLFFGNSTAGNALIKNESSSGSILPVGLGFFDASKAGTATILNNGNGYISFGTPAFLGGTDIAPPIMRRSPTTPTACWISMRSRPPITPPSSPTAVVRLLSTTTAPRAAPPSSPMTAVRSPSSTPAPAAKRSSSPTALALLISGAVLAQGQSRRARSRAPVPITSAEATRLLSGATISPRKSAASLPTSTSAVADRPARAASRRSAPAC